MPQAAHRRHFVGVAGVDHRARAHEQQALEERVRDQVEQAGHPAADAQGQHHVAQLADRRIGEHPFDVGGRDGDRGRDEQRDAADVGDDQQNFGRENRKETARQVHARGHHRGRVDQAPRREWGLPSRRATRRAAETGHSCRRSRRKSQAPRSPTASSRRPCSPGSTSSRQFVDLLGRRARRHARRSCRAAAPRTMPSGTVRSKSFRPAGPG